MLTIRDFRDSDYPRLAELKNLWLHVPETAEDLREEDERFAHGRTVRRWVAERSGNVLGYAAATRDNTDPEGVWFVTVTLDPAVRGEGHAGPLFDKARRYAIESGATVLLDYFRDHDERARRFSERNGFEYVENVFDSVLELESSPAQPTTLPEGIRFVRFSETDQDEAALQKLFHLRAQIESAMPGYWQGVSRPYEAFLTGLVRSPEYCPDAVLIAADGNDWIGLAILFVDGDKGLHDSTGVLPDYQGRGIATALKAETIAWAERRGMRSLRTYNHSDNGPMLAVNAKFGYRREPGWLLYRQEVRP